jgi:hypothetical protein
MNNDYYVYLYLREDGTPYYVGKGKNGRAFSKKGRRMKPPSDKSKIVFHSKNLTEDQAFALEKELIAKYGRKDNGTGILRNLTDGGEGMSGHILSDEAKARAIAALNTPKAKANREAALNSPEVKAKRKATLNTPEIKAKILQNMGMQNPEIKAKSIARLHTPEAWTKRKTTLNTPEVKAKRKAAMNMPEVKAKISQNNAMKRPEVKAKHKAAMNTPEARAKRSASMKAYWEKNPKPKKKLKQSTSTANLAPFFMST